MTRNEKTLVPDPLFAESERMAEEENEWWRQREKDYQEEIKRLSKQIAKMGEPELSSLARAGVDRKSMLNCLSVASMEEGDKYWADLLRLKQKQLRSAASRMETLADEAEKCARDPFSKVQSYVVLGAYGAAFGLEWPEPLWSTPEVKFVILGMRGLAKIWRAEAIKCGRFLEFYGDRRINLCIPVLLCKLCLALQLPEPVKWNEVASLLTYAFEASQKKRSVSADSLPKTWKKYGKKMLRSFLAKPRGAFLRHSLRFVSIALLLWQLPHSEALNP